MAFRLPVALAWPTAGPILQSQTNSTIGTERGNVMDSPGTNRVIVPLDSANGSLFYRLVMP